MTTDKIIPGGAQAIAEERTRQIAKGFTADHDRHHVVHTFVAQAGHLLGIQVVRGGVPWCERKSSDVYHRDDLIRAGALIAAAIDRLDEVQS